MSKRLTYTMIRVGWEVFFLHKTESASRLPANQSLLVNQKHVSDNLEINYASGHK